jgi:hypothetical protein
VENWLRWLIWRTAAFTTHLYFWEANEPERRQNINALLAIERILAEDQY